MSILDDIAAEPYVRPVQPLFMNIRDWQTMLTAGYGEERTQTDGTTERRLAGRPVVLYPTAAPR